MAIFLFCLGTLAVLLIIFNAESVRLALLCRPRSRHCTTFYPLSRWSLPHDELRARINAIAPMSSVDLRFETVEGNEMLSFISGCTDSYVDALAQAAEKCVLTVKLLDVVAEGKSVQDAITKLQGELPCSSLSVVSGFPYLSRADIIATTDAVRRCVIQGSTQDTRLPLPIKIILSGDGEHVLIARELARGLASPKTNTSFESLASPRATRRPKGGVLKHFALKSLPFVTKVSMEPELSLIMNSLGGVKGGHSVLDPFAGSGSILLASALVGARRVVGVDPLYKDESAADGVRQNFDFIMNGKAATPSFHPSVHLIASSAEYLLTQDSRSESFSSFDAIITDPPYEMKTSLRTDLSSIDATSLLFAIADKFLTSGGTLVFWFPSKLAGDALGTEPEEMPAVPTTLRMETCIRQSLSPTLSRFLVVMKRV